MRRGFFIREVTEPWYTIAKVLAMYGIEISTHRDGRIPSAVASYTVLSL